MTLAAGQKLGPYEILAKVGQGGMGEVYRARDTRLGREVAIKVSQEQFNERFDREARAISSLNHPNICALYDVGPDYLVMEYVAGESPRGPMPLAEALAIAMQIADALREAHDKGIVHRDLKPANIKITPDGKVKVLDFGLAKSVEAPSSGAHDLSQSPTITSPAMTHAGVILGTAAYMAPEQARGKPVDTRADIWAFGVVLYELITGQRLFKGDDLTETLASVVKDQPELSAVPVRVRRLLEACLQKDPKKRLQSIGDVQLLLQDESMAAAPSRGHVSRTSAIALATTALVATVAAAGLAYVHLRETPPIEHPLRVSIPVPAGMAVGFLELSPDGRRLVMSLSAENGVQLYVRSLESGDLQPLAGTAVAREVFWSPDSRFIGFFADGKLKVVPAAGGPVQVLCAEAVSGFGGAWSRAGVILFSSTDGLRRVDAAGGECRPLDKTDDTFFQKLVFLPDGNHFLYFGGKKADANSVGVFLATLEEPIGRRVLADLSSVVYAPGAAGGRAHLLFLRAGTLMAQPFDEVALQPVGDPFPVADHASYTLNAPHVAASVSADGTLVYLAGRTLESQMTWLDRAGKVLGTVGPRGDQAGVSLSRDGNLVAIARVTDDVPAALFLIDLARGSESRLTPSGAPIGPYSFAPDSRHLWFGTFGPDGPAIFDKDLNTGQLRMVEKLDLTGRQRTPTDWSPDGRLLIYSETNPKTRVDIAYAPVENGKPNFGAAVTILGTDANESQGQLSPDGKWLAYFSSEGTGQVYVRSFPEGTRAWKVSLGRAIEPRWRADGKELFFLTATRTGQATLTSASIEPDGHNGLRIGVPQKLFDTRLLTIVPQDSVFSYSPHPDGQRFLMNVPAETGDPTVNVITHWQQAVASDARPR